MKWGYEFNFRELELIRDALAIRRAMSSDESDAYYCSGVRKIESAERLLREEVNNGEVGL